MTKPNPNKAPHKRDTVTVDANGCWITARKPLPSGYIQATLPGRKTTMLHRFYYEKHKGVIPEGMQIDHLCRNRACVNPEHLEPVTPRENIMRSPLAPAAINANKTHCSRHGHPLSGENLILLPDGRRTCRECARESSREFQRRTGQARKWQEENRDRYNEMRRKRRARKRAEALSQIVVERPTA